MRFSGDAYDKLRSFLESLSASAGVGICLANLAKDQIFFFSQLKMCLAFFYDRN